MIRQFILMASASAVLWSCGGSQQDASGEGTESGKKIFRYNQSEGLTSLDPARSNNQANIWAISQMYGGLFELSSDLHEHPAIADTWHISDDGLEYTITLKKGIMFHDNPAFPGGKGREVTAADFVYSFKRLMDPVTASTGAWIFADKVMREKNGAISDTCFVAKSTYELKIYLAQPFAPFIDILAMPYAFVVPKEAVDTYGVEFRRNPVGTGPFMLKTWDEGANLVMVKNPSYWKPDAQHNKLPYIDAVQVSFMPDKNQEFLTFKQGKLDFVSGFDASSRDQIIKKDGTIREEISSQFIVQKVPYLNTEYIGFQMDPSLYEKGDHPFLNLKVRQAMSYAINREELVSFLRNNLGVPATNGFVPSALPSFDEGKVKGYGFDLEKGRSLLKEAGYPQGNGLTEFTLYTSQPHQDIAEYLAKQWTELGLKVKIELNNFAAHQEMVDKGKVTLFRGSWLGDYPDEENFLSVFSSKNFSPKGPNKTHFKNDRFDELYSKVHLEKDGWKRHEMYHEMDQLVMDNAPVIVLFYDEVLRLMQKNISGLTPNGMNLLRLETVDFKKEEAAQ